VPRPRVLLLSLAAAGLLAGCGDQRPPEEVARRYVASDDPGKCKDAAQSFLERQTRRRGEAARAACRRAVERVGRPLEVAVASREVRDDRAEIGLRANGQRVAVRLVKRDGRWQVVGLPR